MYNPNKSYQEKYLKYKTKYLKLKKLVGGGDFPIKILVITFNQGHENYINVEYIKSLITQYEPEIVAIALQESMLNTPIFVRHAIDSITEFAYEPIDTKSMFQGILGYMHLSIYKKIPAGNDTVDDTKDKIVIKLDKITTSRCKYVDPGGLFKGGIIAYLNIKYNSNSIYLAIVCSHLPSNPAKPDKRNDCLKKLIKEIQSHKPQYDNIIFTGDLNYRTSNKNEPSLEEKNTMVNTCVRDTDSDGKPTVTLSNTPLANSDSTEENQSREKKSLSHTLVSSLVSLGKTVKKKFKRPNSSTKNGAEYDNALKNFNEYTRADQLTTSLSNNLSNLGLKESQKNFCPTCKLNLQTKGERNRNQPDYDDKRFPSWCDRVLYKGENLQPLTKNPHDSISPHIPHDSISPHIYDSINLSNKSDHLAVYQLFTLTIPT